MSAATAARTARRGWVVVLVAALALLATVAVRPPHAPPLYDGIGFPDEPYRWVVAPPGQTKTAAEPTAARGTVQVTKDGDALTSRTGRGFSSEQGPQIAFAVADGAFAVADGTPSVEVALEPEAAPPAPPYAEVVSNLYRISVTGGGEDVALAPGKTMVVNLRADAATQQAVVVAQWDGTAWTQLATRQVGTEIYAAQLPGFAPIALLRLRQGVRPTVTPTDAGPGVPGATAGGGTGDTPGAVGGTSGAGTADQASSRTLLLTVGGIVVLLGLALLVLRRRGDEPDGATGGSTDGSTDGSADGSTDGSDDAKGA